MAKNKITMSSMSEVFNSASADVKRNAFKIVMIDIEDIVTNEKNEYSISEIEELALSISLVGIRQNLEVEPLESGKYKLLSGERRYTAVKKLIKEDGREDLRLLPCKVTEPSEGIKIDIPDDVKELWLLTVTNQQRNKTDADRLVDVRNQKIIYQSLIDNGVELTGKQRDLIAAALSISPSTVQRLEFVDNNLSADLKKGFEENKIPLTVAVEAAKKPITEQKKIAKKLEKKGKVTTEDVKAISAKNKRESKISTTLTEEASEQLEKICRQTGLNKSEVINKAIKKYYEEM